MAQKDYLSKIGGQYGQLAGSLLSDKRKRKKKEAYTAIALQAFIESIGAKNRQLDQGLADQALELKDSWGDIINDRNEIWSEWTQEGRKRLDQYNSLGEDAYLNQEAISRINLSNAAQESGITWEERNKPQYSQATRDSLWTSYNAERKRALQEINILKEDPRAQFETKTKFNEKAKSAYLAELDLIKNDPTQKGALRNVFNRMFRTERDKKGNLVSTNAEKIELEEALKKAVALRKTQEDNIEASIASLDDLYSGVVGEKVNNSTDLTALQNKAIILARKAYKQEEIINQKNKDKDIWLEKYPPGSSKGQYKEGISSNFKKANILVNVTNKQKEIQKDTGKYPIERVDLLKNDLDDMWAKNSNGEVDLLTREKFFDALAITELAINEGLIKSGKDALTGAPLIYEALQLWSNEGRFSKVVGEFEEIAWRRDRLIWDKDDILVTLPSKEGYNLVNNTVQTSDAASLHQEQGAENPDDFVQEDADEDGIKKYNRQKMLSYFNDPESKFAKMSKIEQDSDLNALVNSIFPEHEKEIINLFSTSEYRKTNDTKEKQTVITSSEEPQKQTVTRRGVEYTKGTSGTDEELEEFMKTFKSPFIKERIKILKKAIDTNKYGAVGSLLSKQTGTPYRKLTEEQREVAAKALIDELLKDIG
jgi:hypothetical protein|tara:strand:- start:276 stop:2231 length:1956 start_codon:yes stop_codon:yes gene_type:complete